MNCPYCRKYFAKKKDAVNHITKYHAVDLERDNMDASQALYFDTNGRLYGYCMCGCGSKTAWNYKTGKPYKVSDNPDCRERLKVIARANLMKVRGVDQHTLMSDLAHQKEMQSHRKITGKYKFQDGGEVEYMGHLELNWLQFCDRVMDFTSAMIQDPPENIPYYDPKDHITRMYMPDYYLPDYNLMVEIKDGGNHPNGNPAFIKETKYKVALKDDAMRKQTKYNYIRISGANYGPFLECLYQIVHEQEPDNKKRNTVVVITEAATIEPFDRINWNQSEIIQPGNIRLCIGYDNISNTAMLVSISDSKTGMIWYVSDYMGRTLFSRWANPFLWRNGKYSVYKYIGDADAMSAAFNRIVQNADNPHDGLNFDILDILKEHGIQFSDGLSCYNNSDRRCDFIKIEEYDQYKYKPATDGYTYV